MGKITIYPGNVSTDTNSTVWWPYSESTYDVIMVATAPADFMEDSGPLSFGGCYSSSDNLLTSKSLTTTNIKSAKKIILGGKKVALEQLPL